MHGINSQTLMYMRLLYTICENPDVVAYFWDFGLLDLG